MNDRKALPPHSTVILGRETRMAIARAMDGTLVVAAWPQPFPDMASRTQ